MAGPLLEAVQEVAALPETVQVNLVSKGEGPDEGSAVKETDRAEGAQN